MESALVQHVIVSHKNKMDNVIIYNHVYLHLTKNSQQIEYMYHHYLTGFQSYVQLFLTISFLFTVLQDYLYLTLFEDYNPVCIHSMKTGD